jgi:hypothetical protein
MRAIRHYVFVLVGLLGIGGLISWPAAFWVAVGLAASLGVQALAKVTAVVDRDAGSSWAMRLMLAFPILSILVALAASIMILERFGWVAGVAPLILYFGYFALRP